MPFLEENHDAFVLPTSRFNPNGLLTPPESPKFGHVSPPELASTLNSAITREPCNSPQMCRLGSPEAVPQSAQHDLTRVSETIYTIIEQVIEQKLAEAMGPLRLNLRRFDSENTDLGYQVGHLEQHLHTLQSITSNNMELLSSLASQLSTATNIIQQANEFTPSTNCSVFASPRPHQQDLHNIQPQFCFEPRSSKRQRRSHAKSRKPRLVNYMLSKWRTSEDRG